MNYPKERMKLPAKLLTEVPAEESHLVARYRDGFYMLFPCKDAFKHPCFARANSEYPYLADVLKIQTSEGIKLIIESIKFTR
jgi:hypothetical protein